MIETVYLARVIGMSLIVLGLVIAIRRDYYITVYPRIVTEKMTRMVFATIAVIAALFLLVAHNIWLTIPAAIISFIGWMLLLEGVAYLVLPDETLTRLIGAFNKPIYYVAGGIVAVIAGAYLTAFGYGAWSRF